jgi:uncharacterized protein with FMN-binding domain
MLAEQILAQDQVEFPSGSKLEGKVLSIRKDSREFDFEATVSGRIIQRTFSYDQVRAVTIGGTRYVLNAAPPTARGTDSQIAGASSGGSSRRATGEGDNPSPQVSQAEIERIIADAGGTAPDWYAEAPLEYPPTLDLSWPLEPQGKGWQAHKYVFHYLWSNVYPNPSRWQSGARLIHHILTLHRDEPALLTRDMRELGHMYFRLFQDYPRAAFWYRKSGVEKGTPASVHLAECYWRLGNKSMAMDELKAPTVPLDAIKLLSDMGETERALRLVDAFARAGRSHEAYLLGGDACRSAGRLKEAVDYYHKVLENKRARNAEYLRRFHARANESIEAIELIERTDPGQVADGRYQATTTGYAGPLEVQVSVAGGRIDFVRVTRHKEKQFYSALKDIPARIVDKQAVQGIDAVSGATVTSQAIVNATAKALASGAR